MTASRRDGPFCPACGSSRVETKPVAHLHCLACDRTDWRNPKPVAGALVLDESEQRILLVRRSALMEFGAGGWVFPGGFVERGETPWHAAVRESWEEAGIRTTVTRALRPRTVLEPNNVVMPFLAHLEADATPRPGPECSEVCWFLFEAIPWDAIPFSTTVEALRSFLGGDRGTEVYREVSSPGRPRPHNDFCTDCGTPTGAPRDDVGIHCHQCHAVRFVNPAPTAGFLPIHDRRVLLGRRRAGSDGAGAWALPSGHMELGETPEITAVRELLEETGLRGQPERFVGLFASDDHSEAIYTGPLESDEIEDGGEFDELRWFTGPDAAALETHHGTPDLIAWARSAALLD